MTLDEEFDKFPTWRKAAIFADIFISVLCTMPFVLWEKFREKVG